VQWIVDTHNDVLGAIEKQQRDFRTRSTVGHTDLPRLLESGMRLEFFSCFLPPAYKPERALCQQLEIVDRFWRVVGDDPEHFRPVLTRADVAALDSDPRVGALISLEGAEAVTSLGVLRMFYRLGVRCIALTWNERNHLADGVGMEAGGGGLSALGLEVVREMQRLGILFDVSHIHPRGFWHYVENSAGPFIASHSNAKAVWEHRRNLDDDQIRAIAARDGSIGLNFAPAFVHEGARLEHVLDHADHMLSLVGDRHVHIGADFDGIDATPEGLEDVTRLPALAEAMLGRGYPDETVRRILGENMKRVLLAVLPAAGQGTQGPSGQAAIHG
jgi:membrane dipeptidase